MSDQNTEKAPEQQQDLELDDLKVAEPEIEVISNDDARAVPEGGASFGDHFCCTICSSSL